MNDLMTVHYLGTVTPRADIDRLSKVDRYPHTAANEQQWAFIDAIRKANFSRLYIFSTGAISEFPRFPQILVSRRRLRLTGRDDIRFIPYVNLMGIKQVTQLLTTIAVMFRKALATRADRSVFLIYSLQTPFLLTAFFLRWLFGIPAVLIITDLPEYMNLEKADRGLRAVLKSLDVRLLRKLVRRADGAIVVAQPIARDYLPPGMPCVVIDSIRDVTLAARLEREPDFRKKVILYSGGLSEAYGVKCLLDAFCSIEDSDYELWLAGRGDLEPAIRMAAAKDCRIRYFGQVPLDELRKLQSQASLLVSVKPGRQSFTQYSFSTKITEYMACGRPVASTASPSIGPEYFEYIHRLSDDSPAAMKASLRNILEQSPSHLMERAKKGQDFLRSTRSTDARGRTLAAFLGSFRP